MVISKCIGLDCYSHPRVDQNITFAAIPDKDALSANFALDANATSGLPVSFQSLNPSIATVDANGTVSILSTGVATFRASQDGNQSFNPAPTVDQTLTITKVYRPSLLDQFRIKT